jgi:hypothetical protein
VARGKKSHPTASYLALYFSTNHSHQYKKIQPSAEWLRIHPRFEKRGLLRGFVKNASAKSQ